MLYISIAYAILTLVMGVPVLWKGAWYPGLAGIIGPFLCWGAAVGLHGSLMVGTASQQLGGLGLALVFVTVGIGSVYHSGYGVEFFGYRFTGVTWCLVGFVIGWLATRRKWAETDRTQGGKP